MNCGLGKLGLTLLLSVSQTSGQGLETMSKPRDPDAASRASIDRFSENAGHLMVRTGKNGLPGPDEPIDFDRGPFVTQGIGPEGQIVRYYNFDVMSTTPAPIYVLFREGESEPVQGQLNIVDVIPGDAGYNDLWQVINVIVPRQYLANTITSVEELRLARYRSEPTGMLVNCPIVPDGSRARQRGGAESADLHRGWYRGEVVYYFTFEEKALTTTPQGTIPTSSIFVAFNINPDQPSGGPASGFMTAPGSFQTHNVVQTIPSDDRYSPLWLVHVYDNADFTKVRALDAIDAVRILASGVALVNCPIVHVES